MGKDPDHGSRRLPMANEVPTQDWECLTAELKRLIRNSLSHNTYTLTFQQQSLEGQKGHAMAVAWPTVPVLNQATTTSKLYYNSSGLT